MSDDFGRRVQDAVQDSIIQIIRKGEWVLPNYESRVKIDVSFVRDALARVDMTRVMALVSDEVERKIADKIFDSMATEIATDVKQIVGNKELREDVRALIRQKIRDSVAAVSKEAGR